MRRHRAGEPMGEGMDHRTPEGAVGGRGAIFIMIKELNLDCVPKPDKDILENRKIKPQAFLTSAVD
jgi:hypothetical protein